MSAASANSNASASHLPRLSLSSTFTSCAMPRRRNNGSAFHTASNAASPMIRAAATSTPAANLSIHSFDWSSILEHLPAGRTHCGPPNRPVPELLNEYDKACRGIDGNSGFEFSPIVDSANLLQLFNNGNMVQPPPLVFSAEYILCTRIRGVCGKNGCLAGCSGR